VCGSWLSIAAIEQQGSLQTFAILFSRNFNHYWGKPLELKFIC